MVCKVLPARDVSVDRVPELGPVEQGVVMAYRMSSPATIFLAFALGAPWGKITNCGSTMLQSASLAGSVLHRYPLSYVRC